MDGAPKTKQPYALSGLSLDDRNLMLAMMAALGSATQVMMAAAKFAEAHEAEDDHSLSETLEANVNANIDLIKKAKDRLKPGSAVLVN